MEKLLVLKWFINHYAGLLLDAFTKKEKIGEYRKFLGIFKIKEKCKINKYLKFFCFKRAKYIHTIDKEKAVVFLRMHHDLRISEVAYKKAMSLLIRLGDQNEMEKVRKAFEYPETIYEEMELGNSGSKKVKDLLFLTSNDSPEQNVYQEYISALQTDIDNSFSNMKELVLAEKENAILKHIESQDFCKKYKDEEASLKTILNLMLVFPDYIYRIETAYKIAIYLYKGKLLKKGNGFI